MSFSEWPIQFFKQNLWDVNGANCLCMVRSIAAKCHEHHEIFTNEHIRSSLMLIADTQ